MQPVTDVASPGFSGRRLDADRVPMQILALSSAASDAAMHRRPAPTVEARLVLAAAVLLAGYVTWIAGTHLGAWPVVAEPRLVASLSTGTIYLLGAMLQWRVSRHPALDRATRRAWLLLALASLMATLMSAEAVFRHFFAATASPGTGHVMTVVYAVTNLLVFASLLSFPVSPKLRADRITFWLDAGTVFSAELLLTWHFLLREALERSGGGGMARALDALLFPAADVMLLFAAITLLLRTPLPSSAAALRIFAFALALSVLADILFIWNTLAGMPSGRALFNALFATVAWLSGVAAYVQHRGATRDATAAPSDVASAPRRSYSLLPFLALALVMGALAFEGMRLLPLLSGQIVVPDGRRSPLMVLIIGTAVVTAFVVARQIVALRRNEELVADRLAREAYFSALVQHSSDVILVLEQDGTVRQASPAVREVLGCSPSEIVGRSLLSFVDDREHELARADLAAVMDAADGDEPPPTAALEWRLLARNGESRWIEVLCTNLLAAPSVRGVVVNGRDISERKRLEAELTYRAEHDALTGLANRASFRSSLAMAYTRQHRPRRTDGRPASFAVMYLDLDGFKEINDSLGHAAGDAVLTAIGQRLLSATRGIDVVARIGGDEFAVLLDVVCDEADTRAVVERARASIAAPIPIGDITARVGASIGVAFAPDAIGEGPVASTETALKLADMLLQQADAAMYEAKLRGRVSRSPR